MKELSGRRFAVVALGCRVNHYEAEALVSMLEAAGALHLSEDAPSLDAVVLVTCAITSNADTKTRKLLRRFRGKHPKAAIVACGCYAQGVLAAEAKTIGADILVGNRLKHRIPALLAAWFGGGGGFFERREDLARCGAWDALALDRLRIYTRAFLKVQEGCSHGCSYCIVPQARGAPVSRDPDDLCREAERVVSSGCREVILTGVHLGSYRCKDLGLGGLIRMLSDLPGLSRLRLGSLEPFGLDDDLFDAMAASDVFCPHLHLPLQSGDDGVLRRMRRGYAVSGFAETARRAREALGRDVHLSTDLIVGFPGESDGAFRNSLGLIERLSLGRVHVFPFSPRRGTPAADFPDAIPASVMKERAAAAIALSNRLLTAYASRWVGRDAALLAEKSADGVVAGWSRHYVRAFARADAESVPGTEVFFIPETSAGGILFGEGTDSGMVVGDAEIF